MSYARRSRLKSCRGERPVVLERARSGKVKLLATTNATILVALATYWAERRQLPRGAATGAIHARSLWSTDVINFALTRPRHPSPWAVGATPSARLNQWLAHGPTPPEPSVAQNIAPYPHSPASGRISS
jgi:hypothetical protein